MFHHNDSPTNPSYEFNPDDLLPPTEQTYADFMGAVDRLPFKGRSTRSIENWYANDSVDGSLHVHVSEDRDDAGQHKSSHIGFSVNDSLGHTSIGNRIVEFTQSDELERIANVVSAIAAGLPDEERNWLQTAWGDMNVGADTPLLTHAVEQLLGDSPYTVREHSLQFAQIKADKRRVLFAQRIVANEAFLADIGDAAEPSVLSIEFDAQDGKEYEYDQQANGSENLSIRNRTQEVHREEHRTQPVSTQSETGLQSTISGSPEFMRAFHAELAARQEAQRLGLDTITEGKLKELTIKLNELINT